MAKRVSGVFEHRVNSVGITQFGGLDQFQPFWAAATKEFSTTSFICGYMTIAHVRLLYKLLQALPADRLLKKSEAAAVCHRMSEYPDIVLKEVRRAMKNIQKQRNNYIQANLDDFPTKQSKDSYLRALVASYEISDELRSSIEPLQQLPPIWKVTPNAKLPTVHFARENEFPQLVVATHEEKKRIQQEQSRFGGVMDLYGVTHIDTEKGESGFLFERFPHIPDGASTSPPMPLHLHTPNEWRHKEIKTMLDGKIWAIHVEGHYISAFSCLVEGSDAPKLHIFSLNTVGQDNTNQPIMETLLHSL